MSIDPALMWKGGLITAGRTLTRGKESGYNLRISISIDDTFRICFAMLSLGINKHREDPRDADVVFRRYIINAIKSSPIINRLQVVTFIPVNLFTLFSSSC